MHDYDYGHAKYSFIDKLKILYLFIYFFAERQEDKKIFTKKRNKIREMIKVVGMLYDETLVCEVGCNWYIR